MGTKVKRYPTAKQLQMMSLQELVDRGLIALPTASQGAVDPR